MNAIKVILGTIISVLGFSLAWAGWAIVTYGQWTAVVNIFIGVVLAIFGLGFVWSGVMLLTGATVRDVLGGMVTALPGHSGIGLHAENRYRAQDLSRLKYILSRVVLYTILVIIILLISVLSVGRVMRDFRLSASTLDYRVPASVV